MSDLSEQETIDRMKSALKEAGQASLDLATITTRRVKAYVRLRTALGLVEGSCRQLSVFREDTRWLRWASLAEQAHVRAGHWLRGYKDVEGKRIHYTAVEKKNNFTKLAANLAFMLAGAERLLTERTGRIGPILPVVPNLGRRIGAPVRGFSLPGEYRTKTGIILPRQN